ncbi:hypothetical protein [Nocardia sp. NPDC002869]
MHQDIESGAKPVVGVIPTDFDALVTVALLGAATERIELGTAVALELL